MDEQLETVAERHRGSRCLACEHQLETVSELGEALAKLNAMDDPVYVRTPHGSYHFVVQGVERVVVEGEQRTVIVVREVEWSE